MIAKTLFTKENLANNINEQGKTGNEKRHNPNLPGVDSTMLLSPFDVLLRGFEHCALLPFIDDNDTTKKRFKEFKETYGSSPVVLAFQWEDLVEEVLEPCDKTELGFKFFLATHYFAFHYP